MSFTLVVGARASSLSKKQVQEVYEELKIFHPHIEFSPVFLHTTGDKDQKTSLRELEKTDFFTKELDQLLLDRKCHITIHSAKDLPDPLPQGVAVVAITKGVDSSDVLVLSEKHTLATLPQGAKIGTSSIRREMLLKTLRPDLTCVDIRGTIEQRLQMVDLRVLHGVIIAEAALIRLGLTHLNRIRLEGEVSPLQGKLAILAREGEEEMKHLFKCLHVCGENG